MGCVARTPATCRNYTYKRFSVQTKPNKLKQNKVTKPFKNHMCGLSLRKNILLKTAAATAALTTKHTQQLSKPLVQSPSANRYKRLSVMKLFMNISFSCCLLDPKWPHLHTYLFSFLFDKSSGHVKSSLKMTELFQSIYAHGYRQGLKELHTER